MAKTRGRILCVGKELDFLRIRCEVLTREGYHAQAVSTLDAIRLVQQEVFDLVILSALLSDTVKAQLLAAIDDRMQTLELHGPTFPRELLNRVEEKLAAADLSR